MHPSPDDRRSQLLALHAQLRSCRLCHEAGFLDPAESVPIVRDPEPDAPLPRILLVGQAPSLRGTREVRPFAGIAGEKLRAWFERAGIPRDDFYRKIHFAAITRCYPGRLPGARGDRVPTPPEQQLCRPWLDSLFDTLQPAVVLPIGLLAIKRLVGPPAGRDLTSAVGRAFERDGIRYLPLPHPSGVSRWLNDPNNRQNVNRALDILHHWVKDLHL
jgi:uracil-DNA glycosylase